MGYKLIVIGNREFPQPGWENEAGETYATAEAAITEAKRRLSAQLLHRCKPGITAEKLVSGWMTSGERVLIVRTFYGLPPASFSCIEYVRETAWALTTPGRQ